MIKRGYCVQLSDGNHTSFCDWCPKEASYKWECFSRAAFVLCSYFIVTNFLKSHTVHVLFTVCKVTLSQVFLSWCLMHRRRSCQWVGKQAINRCDLTKDSNKKPVFCLPSSYYSLWGEMALFFLSTSSPILQQCKGEQQKRNMTSRALDNPVSSQHILYEAHSVNLG